MSKYQFTESDIYLPGTDIPRNSLGIETPDLLHEVEATLLQQAYTRFITELAPAVRFDENYFKALHRDAYETLYNWAGLYRTVDISKGGSLFCRAAYLEHEAKRIFRELEQEQYLKQAADWPSEKFADAVYVLHAFQKKTQQTRKEDIELAAKDTESYYWLIWVEASSPNQSLMLSNDNMFETKCKECVQP